MSLSEIERIDALLASNRIDAETASKYKRVLGKPSQFMPLVSTVEDAIEHWHKAALYEVEEARKQAELEEEMKKDGPQKRGRPPGANSLSYDHAALNAAKAEWREAIAMRRTALAEMQKWVDEKTKELRTLKSETIATWDAYVQEKRSNLNNLK